MTESTTPPPRPSPIDRQPSGAPSSYELIVVQGTKNWIQHFFGSEISYVCIDGRAFWIERKVLAQYPWILTGDHTVANDHLKRSARAPEGPAG